ncbi:MAG: NADH-quinone oxidoreductase subunit J [Rhodothermales bacterium]
MYVLPNKARKSTFLGLYGPFSLCDLFLLGETCVPNFDLLPGLSAPFYLTFLTRPRRPLHASTPHFMIGPILFAVFAVAAIAGALGMLISKNPVSSALWLIMTLFCVAGLYLTLNATFIAVVQILVYAGAIMVLFLFVIMLLNLAELPTLQTGDGKRFLGYVGGTGVFAALMVATSSALGVLPEPVSVQVAAETGSATNLATLLFTEYALPFEVIGILLLVATIGAVMLAKRRFV